MLDDKVALFLAFFRKLYTASLVAAPIYIPTTVEEGFLSYTPSLEFTICRLLMIAILTSVR